MALLANPPTRITTSTALFEKTAVVPVRRSTVPAIGLPAASPKAKQALRMPAIAATAKPLPRANSSTAAFFCSSVSSLSLLIPAQPHRPMPARQTATAGQDH